MKRYLIAIFILFLGYNPQLTAQQDFGSEEDANPYAFAFQINTTSDGQTVKCAVLYTNPYGKVKAQYLSQRSWVRQFLGYEKSEANPEGENLAEKYKVFEVPSSVKAMGEDEVEIYSIERTESILQNLWRLRYSEYPFATTSSEIGDGWAAHPDTNVYYLPSNEQFEILENYGVNTINDFFIGEDAFSLLRDMLDKNWQNNYAKGGQELGTE